MALGGERREDERDLLALAEDDALDVREQAVPDEAARIEVGAPGQEGKPYRLRSLRHGAGIS